MTFDPILFFDLKIDFQIDQSALTESLFAEIKALKAEVEKENTNL